MPLPIPATTTDPACNLPSGVEMFTIPMLDKTFSTSGDHWMRFIECGQLFAVDLRSLGATKAMIRIPRAALVAFLEKRAA
jgi:hypothetical protein